MADNRLRIMVEFKKTDEKEMKIYNKLQEFSNPCAIIKDILKGRLPVGILMDVEDFLGEED